MTSRRQVLLASFFRRYTSKKPSTSLSRQPSWRIIKTSKYIVYHIEIVVFLAAIIEPLSKLLVTSESHVMCEYQLQMQRWVTKMGIELQITIIVACRVKYANKKTLWLQCIPVVKECMSKNVRHFWQHYFTFAVSCF